MWDGPIEISSLLLGFLAQFIYIYMRWVQVTLMKKKFKGKFSCRCLPRERERERERWRNWTLGWINFLLLFKDKYERKLMRFDYLFLGQLWYDTSIFPPLDFNKDQWSRKRVTLVRLKRTKTSHPKLLQIQTTKQLYKFPKISHIK